MAENGNIETAAVDSGSNQINRTRRRAVVQRKRTESATSGDNHVSTTTTEPAAESTSGPAAGDGYSINPRTGEPYRLTDAERERERERARRRHQQQRGSIPTDAGITAEVHPSARVGRPRKTVVQEFLEEGPASQLAEGYVATLNFAAGVLVGPEAVMNVMESTMVQAPLTNLIRRTPVGVLDRSRGWLDPVTLIVALLLWGRRISAQVRQKPRTQGPQVTDTAAPVAAPPESVVTNGTVHDTPITSGGVAVPDVIRQHHLGDMGAA